MMAEHIHTFTFTIIYMYIYIISWQYTHIGINSHISLCIRIYIYIHTYVVYSPDPTPTRPPSHSQAVIRERLISHLDLCPLTGRAKTCGTCDLAPTVRRNAKDLPTNGLKIGLKIGFTIYNRISNVTFLKPNLLNVYKPVMKNVNRQNRTTRRCL